MHWLGELLRVLKESVGPTLAKGEIERVTGWVVLWVVMDERYATDMGYVRHEHFR